ncbi:MAG TPA: hypothetical protein VHW02_09815 [Rhizomicrobium sp.]|jgi:hypothetical protein|nr:hypothetical protein [Rhizomicrobium sp.]
MKKLDVFSPDFTDLFATSAAAGATYVGTSGNDDFLGTTHSDIFRLKQGGNDTASGRGGDDQFILGGALSEHDRLDGGNGSDRLILDGDYAGSHALVLQANTLSSIETIRLETGHSYDLDFSKGADAGTALVVNGATLGIHDSLTIRAFGELIGGAGDDHLVGSGGGTTFVLSNGGNDIAKGGSGNDTFIMGAAFNADDEINGVYGHDHDTVILDGDYSSGVVFNKTTISLIETIQVAAGHDYSLTTAEGTVGFGHAMGDGPRTMTVDASQLGAGNSLYFDGSAEHGGGFTFLTGAGHDTFISGSAYDDDGGSGIVANDTFVYDMGVALSGATRDTLGNVEFGNSDTSTRDVIKFAAVNAIDTHVMTGTLSAGTFDSDLQTAINSTNLAGHHAVLFTPDAGGLAGDLFLIVDGNGVAGYQAGEDLVVQLTDPLHIGSISAASFEA